MDIGHRQCPKGGPESYDKEDLEAGDLMWAQEQTVGLMEYAAWYHGRAGPPVDESGGIHGGYQPITIGGMRCYTNGKPKTDQVWYSDGSKRTTAETGGNKGRGGCSMWATQVTVCWALNLRFHERHPPFPALTEGPPKKRSTTV